MSKFSRLSSYIIIIFGSLLVALSLNLFLVPNKIASGGVSGIATVLYHILGYKIGVTILILNIPLFFIGIKYLGGEFILKTITGIVAMAVFTDTTAFLNPLTTDPLLASVYGGIVMGIGMGLVFYAGATTGGSDIAAMVVQKFLPHFSLGQILLLIDLAIIGGAAFVFNQIDLALYGIITLTIATKLIDSIVEGVNFAKGAFIISSKSDEVSEAILENMHRGVTCLISRGMYTKSDKDTLLCVIKRHEVATLKSIVKEIDPFAFVIITEVREVIGEGFKR